MNLFFDTLSAALYAVFVQNLVFSGGYGMSEAIRMAAKPKKLLSAAGMIIWFSTVTAVICSLADLYSITSSLKASFRFLFYVGVLLALYFITCLVTYIVLKPGKKLMSNLSIAALNTLVMAIPMINHSSAMTVPQSIGTGLGSGIAFVTASVLISAGFTAISKNKKIPAAFKGSPIMFIYTAMLSLTFMGISGSTVFA